MDEITITEGGVTVTVRPLGFADYFGLDRALDAIVAMPSGTAAERAALEDACLAFAARIDAYAAEGSPPPSRVPLRSMRAFVVRWAAEVRDAAVDPTSGGPSPSGPRSKTDRSR